MGSSWFIFGGTTSRMEENTDNIWVRVLKAKNKNSHHSYCVSNVPLFDSVTRLKAHLLERCTEELRPAADCNFTFGYIGEGNKKFSITSELQNAETLSLVKKGMITLWVDPHLPKAKNSFVSTLGKKRKGIVILSWIPSPSPQVAYSGECVTQEDSWNSSFSNSACDDQELVLSNLLFCVANPRPSSDDEEAPSSYEACLSRLRLHHKLPEFKLRCWARMLVRNFKFPAHHVKHSQCEEWGVRLFLSQFYTVKFVRIMFFNIFLQIVFTTSCELAFNSLQTHGLHVHVNFMPLLQLLPSGKV